MAESSDRVHRFNPGSDGQNQAQEIRAARVETTSSADANSAPVSSRSLDENSGVTGDSNVTLRVRRRNRQITSCFECRRRKLKCDKHAPCGNCVRFTRDCQYLAPARDARSQRRLAEMKDRMSALEDNLIEDPISSNPGPHVGGLIVSPTPAIGEVTVLSKDVVEVDESTCGKEPLESTPLATLDNIYDDNADDELMDLGVQIGKLRVSERIGGWIRSKLAEELSGTLNDVLSEDNENAADYSAPENAQASSYRSHIKSYIGPGPDYIAPASSLFFPAIYTNSSALDYLSLKPVADLLIAHYADAVHLIARAVHWPTFQAQYNLFWANMTSHITPIPSTQAVIFAALFSAAVSMHKTAFMESFGTAKAPFVNNLRAGTELALSTANFLRTTRLNTLQAFVMYLIPLVRSEVSRAHSALVGTAIRLAQCMGLHKDGSHYSITAIEMQVRRVLWHQLCFLDMRSCEATGPSLQIRQDEHDTHFPLNVDDADFLVASRPPDQDKSRWTDMTLFRIRTELTAIRRCIWTDIVLIDRREKCLTKVLVKIQKICQKIETIYGTMTDMAVPVQQMGRCLLDIGKSGWFIQILHRYITNTKQSMPDRLRQLLIENSLEQMENAIILDTKPELAVWSWYRGALNQYHAAILLIREVSVHPSRKHADRIWKCLDYIFDIPPNLSAKQKGQLVMTDLRDRMAMYHEMRKVKLTARMEERVAAMSRTMASSSVAPEIVTHVDPVHASSASLQATLGENPGNFGIENDWNATFQGGELFPHVSHFSTMDQYIGEDNGQDSVEARGDLWNVMEDIDWSEWDIYFPLEQDAEELEDAN